jgi:hypothetical protein
MARYGRQRRNTTTTLPRFEETVPESDNAARNAIGVATFSLTEPRLPVTFLSSNVDRDVTRMVWAWLQGGLSRI